MNVILSRNGFTQFPASGALIVNNPALIASDRAEMLAATAPFPNTPLNVQNRVLMKLVADCISVEFSIDLPAHFCFNYQAETTIVNYCNLTEEKHGLNFLPQVCNL